MKIVINTCFGGFGLSEEAVKLMADLGSDQAKEEIASGKIYGYGYSKNYPSEYKRDDPLLIKAVEILGKRANGFCSQLEVREIPDGVNWIIEEYDGNEHISEVHRTW